MNEILVACVLRSGGHYAVDYVERLLAGLQQHTPSARLVCLSDVPVPCERIPLLHDWPGWWAKIELFRPGLFDGPVLYLDLDTVVTGDIAPLMDYAHRFTALSDFYRPSRNIGSGVMAWSGDCSELYRRFRANPVVWQRRCRTPELWGDQGFIGAHVRAERWQALFPDAIQSVKQRGPRHLARLMCFHGQPKPRDTGWQIPEFDDALRPDRARRLTAA